jgi:sugar phosphate isomerase/epimerase
MRIGAMNHPKRDPIEEIRWMAEMGLEFIDLTLEPPAAASWKVEPERIREEIERHGFDVVGHTAYYLPIASPFEGLRRAAVEELRRCLEIFGRVGAKWMNVHPDRYAPMHDRSFFIERNIRSLSELHEDTLRTGVGIMVENIPGDFNTVEELGELLEPMPELGLHLDIGHCNLMVEENTAEALIKTYPERLKHVHIHDNKGGDKDLHLAIGAGTMDIGRIVRVLKECGYDGCITLEVFSDDTHFLAYSRDVLRRMWQEA